MSVLLEFSIGATDFELGQVLMGPPSMHLELERVVPMGNVVMPFVWATGEDQEAYSNSIRSNPRVDDLLVLDSIDESVLYRVDWNDRGTNLTEAIAATDATVLEAWGESEWTFRLRFSNHDDLSAFHALVTEHDIPIRVVRTFELSEDTDSGNRFGLTQEQREALVLAFERGYFETPSQVGLDALAAELDISRQALSQRIRLGNEKVLRHALF